MVDEERHAVAAERLARFYDVHRYREYRMTEALAAFRPHFLRVVDLMSPDIAQSLVFGTSKHQLRSRTHVSGTTGYFDVTIDGVCEPQIWTLFCSMKLEMSCRE